MRISTFWYCLRQGIVNICRNIWFSLASCAIVSACIFLFCVFFSIISNIEFMVDTAEAGMGITVFFDEDLSEEEILAIGETVKGRPEIREMRFISAEAAWEDFKTEYLGDDEELAAGFADDNPLAGSASYEIFLDDLSQQHTIVAYLESVPGVRKVNYSNSAVEGLTSFNKALALLFGVIIAMLLAVGVFLISNTISVAAQFRKNENKIMRLIGATSFMIRAPFVFEGTLIGLIGAAVPLLVTYFGYGKAVTYLTERFYMLTGIMKFLPLESIFPTMAGVSFALGGGLGFFVSFVTIRKHLRV